MLPDIKAIAPSTTLRGLHEGRDAIHRMMPWCEQVKALLGVGGRLIISVKPHHHMRRISSACKAAAKHEHQQQPCSSLTHRFPPPKSAHVNTEVTRDGVLLAEVLVFRAGQVGVKWW
jgi:hypothetical protein